LSHSARLFCLLSIFEIGSCKLLAWSWIQTPILLISASWVAESFRCCTVGSSIPASVQSSSPCLFLSVCYRWWLSFFSLWLNLFIFFLKFVHLCYMGWLKIWTLNTFFLITQIFYFAVNLLKVKAVSFFQCPGM
jgi:hypothetical protein